MRTARLAPIAREACTAPTRNGFPVPDANCTPGAIKPTLTIAGRAAPDQGLKLKSELNSLASWREQISWHLAQRADAKIPHRVSDRQRGGRGP
jgi:hypothetical protein